MTMTEPTGEITPDPIVSTAPFTDQKAGRSEFSGGDWSDWMANGHVLTGSEQMSEMHRSDPMDPDAPSYGQQA